MCWANQERCHCDECQREFGHRQVRIPCFEVENGRPCRKLIKGRPVVLDHVTCVSCREARKAEEICQQKIYHQAPLYYNLEKRRCIREAYWARLEANRKARRDFLKKAEEAKAAAKRELNDWR